MVVLSIVLWLIAVIMVALVGVAVCILCADVWKLAQKGEGEAVEGNSEEEGFSPVC